MSNWGHRNNPRHLKIGFYLGPTREFLYEFAAGIKLPNKYLY